MDSLLTNPAVQGGIAPFIVALLGYLLLQRSLPRFMGLALVLAFLTAVLLTTGFSLSPLTSSRKILLAGLLLPALVTVIEQIKIPARLLPLYLFALPILYMLWMISPALSRESIATQGLAASGAVLYVIVIIGSLQQMKGNAVRAYGSLSILGLATGICALLGATALLGQWGMAVGAGALAGLALIIFKQQLQAQQALILPGAVLSVLLALGAVFYASLPWFVLIALALIPLSANRIHPGKGSTQTLRFLILISIPAGAAVFLTWYNAGGPIY